MNRLLSAGGMLFAILLHVGCATLEVPYEPPGHACGWDPVFGSCDTCGTCGGTCEGHTPASYIGHHLRCSSGCGEIYWGPWLSDPPDRCDPCDDCGQWVGDRCCEPKVREKIWWAITGQGPIGGKGKGCATCGGPAVGTYEKVNCGGCGGAGCTSCGGVHLAGPYVDDLYMPRHGSSPHEQAVPEVLPETPDPIQPRDETPAAVRPTGASAFRLPTFNIRSVRLSE